MFVIKTYPLRYQDTTQMLKLVDVCKVLDVAFNRRDNCIDLIVLQGTPPIGSRLHTFYVLRENAPVPFCPDNYIGNAEVVDQYYESSELYYVFERVNTPTDYAPGSPSPTPLFPLIGE